MLLFSPPSDAELERFLARARESHYTYSEVGATSGLIPPLYTTDHNRVLLGKGEADWYRAVTALRAWKMFDLGWMRLYPASTEIRAGENVALVARWFNSYFVNACRQGCSDHVPPRQSPAHAN